MNIKSKVSVALMIATMFLLLFVGIGAAATFQLSGGVTDQFGNPLAGSTVEVLVSNTAIVVASTITDINGNYDVSIDEGAYEVQVTPLPGSGFGSVIVWGKQITGNTVLDFILVPEDVTSLSGQVLHLGNGVSGQKIELTNQDQEVTDNTGHYSMVEMPGNYGITMM
ncbi:MAG: carboxypeptidase regulatory-like domain-containing protein, partial [Anaerolineales bacterium]|nr:carboxypeptidase regulatory-like domain-containing protein [Anaerolineales bacterium]